MVFMLKRLVFALSLRTVWQLETNYGTVALAFPTDCVIYYKVRTVY